VPLKNIAIEAKVYGFFTDVSTNLTYYNDEDKPLEVQFVFPLDANSALYNMTSHCEHTISGEIKEKKQAQIEYQNAIDAGEQASLLVEDDRHSDILNLKLGNIKPGQTCWVHFAFVNDLVLSPNSPELTFTYPIILGERYNADPENGDEISQIQPRENAEDLPYTYSFDFNVIEPHEVKLKATGDLVWDMHDGSRGMSLQPGQSAGANFGIVVTMKNFRPFQYVEEGDSPGECSDQNWQKGEFTNFLGDTTAMLNLLPDFSDETLVDAGQEYVVILDRSGSMEGDRIQQARLTLERFLDNLPSDNSQCRFNILSFGSEHEFLFSESLACSEINIQNAKDEVQTFGADMGGTEMLETFEDLFKQDEKIQEGVQRQIFLLTDGEVSNTQDVIDLVQKHSGKNRIFSFGIGQGVSTELVDGVAQFGGASRILKSGEEQEELNQHVLRALRAAQSSYYFDLDVGLQMSSENLCGRVTSMGNTIFPGEFFEVFVVIRGILPPNGHLGKATLFGKTFSAADETGKRSVIEKSFDFEMHIFDGVDADSLPIHRVAAKRIISALKLNKDDLPSDQRDEQMLTVSLASNVLSPVTALIAVDHDAATVNDTAKKVIVPIAYEEDAMMDMAVAYSMPMGGGPTSFARNIPMMPMPAAISPMVGGGGGYGGGYLAPPSATANKASGTTATGGFMGYGSGTTGSAGYMPPTTTTTVLWPPEYKVLYSDSCADEKFTKPFEADTVDICAAKVNNDDQCSNYFLFDDKTFRCGCFENADDRFQKQDKANCNIYRIPPSSWLNKANSDKAGDSPSMLMYVTVLIAGVLVGFAFAILISNGCTKKKQFDEDLYITLDVTRQI